MKRINLLFAISIACLLWGCSSSSKKGVDILIPNITNCAKLHTAQYNVHKILTYEDLQKLEANILTEKISIPIPGERKLVIPIDAVVSAYIDLSTFGKENISINGEKVEVTLPNPQIVLSSAKIDYKNEKQYLSWNRSKFTNAEKEDFLKQGRQSILASMAQSDIIDRSRINAYNTLLPILMSAGYQKENITIKFSDEIERNNNPKQLINSLTTIKD